MQLLSTILTILMVWTVQYHMLHAVSLLALSSSAAANSCATVAKLWVAGTVLFSGSLYGLALNGPRILGPVTPLGGLCFITGWALLAIKPAKTD